jgi:hypothetical protein
MRAVVSFLFPGRGETSSSRTSTGLRLLGTMLAFIGTGAVAGIAFFQVLFLVSPTFRSADADYRERSRSFAECLGHAPVQACMEQDHRRRTEFLRRTGQL